MKATLSVIGMLGVATALAGCTLSMSEGDRVAHERAEQVMLEVADDLTPLWGSARDADFLAVRAAEHPTVPFEGVTVEPLAWSGNSADWDSGARLELRVAVHVEERNGTSLGDSGHGPGDSVRCWEITVFARNYDEYQLREFPCPDDPAPPLPTPTPLPTMPTDIDQRITAALTAATEADLAERMREQFPDSRITIDVAEQDGELIAAVGLAEGDRCTVGVRRVDGTVELLRGWPWEWLQPGETGCSVGLYLNPPQ